jgi:hypothetical protein
MEFLLASRLGIVFSNRTFITVFLILAIAFPGCSLKRNAPFFLTPQNATIHVGEQLTLGPSYDSSVITAWVSSEITVVTVVNGVVTGQATGAAKVTAYAGNQASEPSNITVIP